jgi:hypothetical protein
VSVHVYLGVMALGADRAISVVESRETWPAGVRARETVRNPIPVAERFDAPLPRETRLVLANPPCSRYSCGSTSAYAKRGAEQFAQLELFPEMLEVVQLFESAPRGEILWWETGPLIRTKGLPMVEAIHRRLEARWTLIVATDPRWGGVPQARPRCHMVHCVSDAPVPLSGRSSAWPVSDQTIGSWMDEQLAVRWAHDGVHHPIAHSMHLSSRTAEQSARRVFDITAFMQGCPKITERSDPAAPTVLSGRVFAWADTPEGPGRWWSAEEFAALTTAPPEWGRRLELARPRRMEAITMMSKGVVGDVAERVCRDYVVPALEGTVRDWTEPDAPRAEEVRDGIWLIRQLAPEGVTTGAARRRR